VVSVFNYLVFWFDVLFITHMDSMTAMLHISSLIGKTGESLSVVLILLAIGAGTGAAPFYITIASVAALGLWASMGLL